MTIMTFFCVDSSISLCAADRLECRQAGTLEDRPRSESESQR